MRLPPMMTRLLARALELGIESAYVKDLMIRRNLLPDTATVENETSPWPVKIYTKGRFAVRRNTARQPKEDQGARGSKLNTSPPDFSVAIG